MPRLIPTPVAGGMSFRTISTGVLSTCGVTVSNTAFCWGNGLGSTVGDIPSNASTPTRVSGSFAFETVKTGGNHSCGITVSGAAYCWGYLGVGQLGTGASVFLTAPTPVSAGPGDWKSVTAGDMHTCGLTSSGSAYCWGFGFWGQRGDGTRISAPQPVAVGGGLTFTRLLAGAHHTCGIANGADLYCWGHNSVGQLAAGLSSEFAALPVRAAGALRFSTISSGGSHTCGLTSAGAAYCWGENRNGELGELGGENKIYSGTPVPVQGGFAFRDISAGNLFTCAVTTGSDVYCWGANAQGQAGNGTVTSHQRTPARVSSNLSFQTVSAGDRHVCALTVFGEAYCWGGNAGGQLGNGSVNSSSIPVAVSGGIRFSSIHTGFDTTCGLSLDQRVFCWGRNGRAELGRSGPDSSLPEPVDSPRRFSSLEVGRNHGCGISDARLFCWGDPLEGRTGDGRSRHVLAPQPVNGGIVFAH